jgi:hypothetical protein
MMDRVLSLVELVNDEESSFFNVADTLHGNGRDSNNCGSGDSRGCRPDRAGSGPAP